MSISGPSEITAKASRGRPDGFLGLLDTVALIAVVAGAAGSVGLMLRAGHPPFLLRVLFAIWVLSPFVALLLANMVFSKRWSVITRATLHSVMLVLALSSLAIYGYAVLRTPRSTPTFVFLVVPLGSWLLFMIVVPIAALISGRLSRRGAGA
jgi:hypothetical protein